MNSASTVSRSVHSPQNAENRSAEFPCKAPIEDGAPGATRLSRFNRAIRAIKAAALPLLVSGAIAVGAIGSGCSGSERGHGPKWDAGPTDTYSDTETEDTDVGTGSDLDSDSDGDSDTITDTEDTETETSTDTGECPDLSDLEMVDDLKLSAESEPAYYWITATSDDLGCAFVSGNRMVVEATEGEFEINGTAFRDWKTTVIASVLHFIGKNDPLTSNGDCEPAGLQLHDPILLAQGKDGKQYAFPFAYLDEGHMQIIYRTPAGEKLQVGFYGDGDTVPYETQSLKDEVRITFPAGYYGQAVVDSIGISISRGQSAALSAAAPEGEVGKSSYKLVPKSELPADKDIAKANSTGMEICGKKDGTTLAYGDQALSGVYVSDSSEASITLRIPKF